VWRDCGTHLAQPAATSVWPSANGRAGRLVMYFLFLAGSGCVACSRIGSSFVSIGAFTRACGGGATWSVVYGCVHVESSCGHGGIEDSAFWTNHRPC
jgi:hypothetical protein